MPITLNSNEIFASLSNMIISIETFADNIKGSDLVDKARVDGTLYGDTNGAIGTIGDIYKTDVWEMSRWINRNEEIIPWNSINKAPSAELRPDQKDTDSLPDYDVLDKALYLHLEQSKSRQEIINEGIDPQIVDKILRLVKINEWKRHQVAPALKMSNSALGIDRIMPIS